MFQNGYQYSVNVTCGPKNRNAFVIFLATNIEQKTKDMKCKRPMRDKSYDKNSSTAKTLN